MFSDRPLPPLRYMMTGVAAKWIQQTIKQGGEWDPELYQLFQRRYFSEDQSSDFVKQITNDIRKAYPETEEPTTHLKVKLSEKEAKKGALQRAVSRMLKADWVVMSDLWIDDENDLEDLTDDELGPEGDALWAKLLNGVGLFEEMESAQANVDDLPGDPSTPEATDAYETELRNLNAKLAFDAFAELVGYLMKNAEGDKSTEAPLSFAEGDFAKPPVDATDDEISAEDVERETIDQAITCLRNKYDLLHAAIKKVEGEVQDGAPIQDWGSSWRKAREDCQKEGALMAQIDLDIETLSKQPKFEGLLQIIYRKNRDAAKKRRDEAEEVYVAMERALKSLKQETSSAGNAVKAFEDKRPKDLKAWKEAYEELQITISKYDGDFPKE